MNKVKLSDITLQIFDGKHGGCTRAFNTGYYFISVKDIEDQELCYENAMQISKEEFDAIYGRTKLENGDTLYANTGDTIGKSVFVENNELASKTAFQKSVAVVKPNDTKVYPPYLYYLLRQATPRLRAAASGSGQKNLLLDTMRNFEINIHEMQDQVKIAETLKPIDDKIKLNNQICRTIDEYIDLIYKYWFVQFDYSDENGNPYKSNGGEMVWNEELKRHVPANWEVNTIGAIITEREKSNMQVNATEGRYGAIPFFTSGSEIIMCDTVLTTGKNCFLNTGGNADIKYYVGNAAYSTDTWCITAEAYSNYLYEYIVSIKDYLDASFFAGSGLKHLQKEVFKAHKIIIPPMGLIEKFNSIADRCFQKISELKIENYTLSSLRDFILPMLMNGQVKVG